jgi:hypothetical protein
MLIMHSALCISFCIAILLCVRMYATVHIISIYITHESQTPLSFKTVHNQRSKQQQNANEHNATCIHIHAHTTLHRVLYHFRAVCCGCAIADWLRLFVLIRSLSCTCCILSVMMLLFCSVYVLFLLLSMIDCAVFSSHTSCDRTLLVLVHTHSAAVVVCYSTTYGGVCCVVVSAT